MKNRTLVALPVLVGVAFLAAQAFVPPGPARSHFFLAEITFVKLLALAGCLAAASRYRLGEYIGAAWLLIGADYALLVAKDLMFGKLVHLPGVTPEAATTLRAIFVVGANGTSIVGSMMLARVWRVAGIALPGSRRSRVLVGVGAAAIGLGIVAWTSAHDLVAMRGGDRDAVVSIASSLGDAVSFIVIAPLLLTALAMRGGALFWPWAFITASNVGWLLYDLSWGLQRQWPLAEVKLRTLAELWRAVACALALSAGLAQRRAMRSAARGAATDTRQTDTAPGSRAS